MLVLPELVKSELLYVCVCVCGLNLSRQSYSSRGSGFWFRDQRTDGGSGFWFRDQRTDAGSGFWV